MSFGEPIALRAPGEIEQDAAAAFGDVRTHAEVCFIERLRAGEAAAFDYLVSERSGEIYALLYRLTEDREEARDLTQETFLQAFRCAHQFRGDASVKTWLYRIAVNLARNRWRWWTRRRRHSTTSLDLPEHGQLAAPAHDARTGDPEVNAMARERERILHVALSKLRRPFREVVVLRDIEGLSYEDVAAALTLSIGTVKSRLARGRGELRRLLEGSL